MRIIFQEINKIILYEGTPFETKIPSIPIPETRDSNRNCIKNFAIEMLSGKIFFFDGSKIKLVHCLCYAETPQKLGMFNQSQFKFLRE